MGLQNMSLTSVSEIAVTGGSAIVFALDGQTVANGLHLACITDVDFATRRGITIKQRAATLDPKTGEYGKDKKSMVFVEPFITPSGRVFFNTWRIEREVHPLSVPGVIDEGNKLAAQLLIDTDAMNFWQLGTMI